MTFSYQHQPELNLDIIDGPSLTLTVRRLGAEVIGLTRRHPQHGEIGLLWRNAKTHDPPKYWKGHATVLFPIVGGIHNLRSSATDGTKVWFKKQHGFVRHSVLEMTGTEDHGDHLSLGYRLVANEETLSMYPWRFSLEIEYSLYANRLKQTMKVTNLDVKPMPFQLGWHPGFNTPFRAGKKADCHLRLPAGPITLMLNDEDCYLTDNKQQIQNDGDFPFTEEKLDLTYMFDLSAVDPNRRIVELLDADEKTGVRVHFADYPHLGLWSDANAPFICIEPWQGMDDSVDQEPFDKKFGMTILPPGTSGTRQAVIEVID